MSGIISGFGWFDVDRKPGGAALPEMLFVEPLMFEINGASTKKQAKKKNAQGKTVIAGTRLDEEIYTMKLSIEAASWTAIQFALGYYAGAPATVEVPKFKFGRVPSVSPFEIADPEIGTSAALTQVAVTERNGAIEEGKLPLGTATPGAGQYYPDTTNNKLIFHSGLAGSQIVYRTIKSIPNVSTVGQLFTAALDEFAFSAIGKGDNGEDYLIDIPKATRASAPSLNISDVTKLEIEFDLPSSPGSPLPFGVSRLPANWAA